MEEDNNLEQETKTFFVVLNVIKKTSVDIKVPATAGAKELRVRAKVPLILADGMVGMLPVFEDKEKAKEFAEKNFGINGAKIEEVLG